MLEGFAHTDRCPADNRGLVLASSSPRRQELLLNLGLRFEVDASDAAETLRPEASIAEAVTELALQKARTVAVRHPSSLVIAADTLVSLDGRVLGKPADADEACEMLRRLSGRRHRVFTGLVVLDAATLAHESRVVETDVYFRELSDSEIEAYVATGEPLDKAGSYGMQRLGSVFVSRIDGDYFNVIGLPLLALNGLLKRAGCCLICRGLYEQGRNGARVRGASTRYEVVVVGGGAAGLMCAIEAGKRGRSVLLIESNDQLGKKILVSGGGRCNFTNLYAGPENYISNNPDFCRSALARYTPADFIVLVEQHGIAYHEKKLGQLFCDGSARQIVEMLEQECEAAGVEVRLNCRVETVRNADGIEMETNLGDFACTSLVVATGGLSIPKIGATDFGYRLAQQLGLKIVPPRPGLVPLTFSGEEQELFASLSGVSVDAIVSTAGQAFRENLLFTHRSVSGPAILQASSYWTNGAPLAVDLLPGVEASGLLSESQQETRELATLLGDYLPRRFAQAWCAGYAPSRPLNRYTSQELADIARRLQAWQLQPTGTLGFAKAEVTVGGVDTNELSSRTMEARRVPGLYFIGEVVDVTGWLGGYNFQWAWASGHAAGQAV